MDWLKSADNDNNVSESRGLLLAPVFADAKVQVPEKEFEIEEKEKDFEQEIKPEPEKEIEETNEEFNVTEPEPEPEIKSENESGLEPEPDSLITEINEPEHEYEEQEESNEENQDSGLPDEIFELNKKFQEIQDAFDAGKKEIQDPEEDKDKDEEFDVNDKEWQERATGFELSLDEPPPELWTGITPEDYDPENGNYNDEDEELDYEQGMSLQGAAYVPKAPKNAPGRGANFTERLHQSLRGRKQKAEQIREREEEKKPRQYKSKIIIICMTFLMLLGLAFLALWFIQRWTPENINERANLKLQNGEYEEAMNLFYSGYKRYPNVLSFLMGVAKSAESAGRIQTAITAWEAYSNALPKNDAENRNSAQSEIRRLKGEPEPQPEQEALNEAQEKEPEPEKVKEVEGEIKEEQKHEEETKEPEPKIPATFDEFLSEANSAYNSKLYNTAIIYFHRAIELKGSDIRPYIGLAAAYQAKNMPADAKIILDEAKRKFKRNPTVETQSNILERK